MHCKYHPTSPAQRHCGHCQTKFCDTCSDESATRPNNKAEHRCFVCGYELAPLSTAESVPAFWRALGNIYRYPLSIASGAVIAIIAFISAWLPFSSWLQLIPAMSMLLYCFACLRETATGKATPPDIEKCFEGSLNPIFFSILLTIIAAIITGFVAELFGAGFGILIGSFFVATLPAAIIVLAIEERLLPAMNLVKLVSVVNKTGVSYFVMLLFILIMASSIALISSILVGNQASFINLFLQSLISNYYFVVIYHILGYLVLQNHTALGFNAHQSNRARSTRSEQDRLNAQMGLLIKAGDYAGAKDIAKRLLGADNVSAWQWERTFSLMCTGRSTKDLAWFWPKYMTYLIEQGRTEQIADTYIKIRKRIKDLSIQDPSNKLTIATALHELGFYKYTVNLLNDFHSKHSSKSPTAEQTDKAFHLQIDSFSKIPGMQKHAQKYQRLRELTSSSKSA